MIVRTRPLTTEEAARYVKVLCAAALCDRYSIYSSVAALAIGTGARIGEVLAMRNADVLDLQNGRVRDKVRRKIEKKRGQIVYKEAPFCDPVLWGVVQTYAYKLGRMSAYMPADGKFFTVRWNGAKLTYKSAWENNRKFLLAAGIDPHGVAFHGLRKTFLTAVFREIYRQSGDMLKALTCAQKLAGHENINTTIVYLDIQAIDEEATIRAALQPITGRKFPNIENGETGGIE